MRRIAADLPAVEHVKRTQPFEKLETPTSFSGGGGIYSTAPDYLRLLQALLNGGSLDGRTYLSPAAFTAMTTDHIGPGTGIGRNVYYYPGDGYGYGYGFAIRTDPGVTVPVPVGSLGEIQWDSAAGVYIVVDRAEDMFFVVMQDSPSGRMRVITTVKKIIYDAFEK